MNVRYDPRTVGKCDHLRREKIMKKLLTLMLGTALALGCVTATFAQDTKKTEKTKKPAKTKKSKSETTKKS